MVLNRTLKKKFVICVSSKKNVDRNLNFNYVWYKGAHTKKLTLLATRLDFLADMSAKLWPPPLSPFSWQKKESFFASFFLIYIPIEPECSKMDNLK